MGELLWNQACTPGSGWMDSGRRYINPDFSPWNGRTKIGSGDDFKQGVVLRSLEISPKLRFQDWEIQNKHSGCQLVSLSFFSGKMVTAAVNLGSCCRVFDSLARILLHLRMTATHCYSCKSLAIHVVMSLVQISQLRCLTMLPTRNESFLGYRDFHARGGKSNIVFTSIISTLSFLTPNRFKR